MIGLCPLIGQGEWVGVGLDFFRVVGNPLTWGLAQGLGYLPHSGNLADII